jgi:hypothetical protein
VEPIVRVEPMVVVDGDESLTVEEAAGLMGVTPADWPA